MEDKTLSNLERRVSHLELDIAVLRQQMAERHPVRTYYDVVLTDPKPVPLSDMASDYGTDRDSFARLLDEHRLRACYVVGEVSAADRLRIYHCLKTHGMLPVMERKVSS